MRFSHYTIEELDLQKWESFFQLIDANRSHLEAYFQLTVSSTLTLDLTQAYFQQLAQNKKERTYFPFIIIDSRTQEWLGMVDLKNIDWRIPKGELGYFIDKKVEGKGIISQAVDQVINHLVAKYGFKKLLCRVDAKNTGSVRVAEKNQFQLEGVIRNDYKKTNGEVVDMNYYGRVF